MMTQADETTMKTTAALVPAKPTRGGRADELTRHDMVESRLYPQIRTAEQAGVVLAKARNHGLCPTFVAENLIPIQGKMCGTGLYLAAVLKGSKKYRYRTIKNTRLVCELEFLERVDGAWEAIGTEQFSMEDAKAAGLAGSQTWQKYPQHMLFWRALSGGARKHCPDALAGSFKYLIEEVAGPELEFDEDGVPVGGVKKVTAKVLRVDPIGADDDDPLALEGLRAEVTGLCAETGTELSKVEEHFGSPLEGMTREALGRAAALLRLKLPPASAPPAAKPKGRAKTA